MASSALRGIRLALGGLLRPKRRSGPPAGYRPRELILLLAPALALYLLFVLYPVVSGLYYGLTDWNGFTAQASFVGLRNFFSIPNDPLLIRAVGNTLIYTVLTVLLQCGLGLLLAVALNQKLRGRTALRAVVFSPFVLSTVVVGYLWTAILSPVSGTWNALAPVLGLGSTASFDLLGNPDTALLGCILITVWQYSGLSMVLYLAGLQGIPREVTEAARVDGAGAWSLFRSITFPLLGPATTVNVILTTVSSLREFDHIFILTGGGPGDASQVVGTVIFGVAFQANRYAYGAAVSTLLLIGMALIGVPLLTFLRRREVAM